MSSAPRFFQNIFEFEKENFSAKTSLISLSVTDILSAILSGTYRTPLLPTARIAVPTVRSRLQPVGNSLGDLANPSGNVVSGIAMTAPLTRSDESGYLEKRAQHFEMKSICILIIKNNT